MILFSAEVKRLIDKIKQNSTRTSKRKWNLMTLICIDNCAAPQWMSSALACCCRCDRRNIYFVLAPLHSFDNISFHSFIPITFAAYRSFTCCRLFRATNLFISMQPALNTCTAASDGTVPLHFRMACVFWWIQTIGGSVWEQTLPDRRAQQEASHWWSRTTHSNQQLLLKWHVFRSLK